MHGIVICFQLMFHSFLKTYLSECVYEILTLFVFIILSFCAAFYCEIYYIYREKSWKSGRYLMKLRRTKNICHFLDHPVFPSRRPEEHKDGNFAAV